MSDQPILLHPYPRSPSPLPHVRLHASTSASGSHAHRRSPSPSSNEPKHGRGEADDEWALKHPASPRLSTSGHRLDPDLSDSRTSHDRLDPLDPLAPLAPPGSLGGPVPVPWRTICPLLFFCAADAMTYAIVFPWIVDMITSFHVPQDRIGLYGGLAEGIMMLVEAACATTWARLADKYGRRPCLLLGFGFPMLAMPLLGFAGAVWQVVLFRGLLGLGPGGVIVKICAAELSHPSNRSTIFSILSPAFGSGFLLGTFLGGELAHPYGRLPWWMGGTVKAFERAPFALPCLVTFGVDMLALAGGWMYLPETQKVKRVEDDFAPDGSGSGEKHKKAKGLLRQTMRVPTFMLAIGISLLFQVSYFSWDGMFTVFTYTTTDKGGLGLGVDMIGILYSLGSSLSLVTQPLFLTRFTDALGVRKALTIVLCSWTVLALVIPLSQWSAVHARFLMWSAVTVLLLLRTFGNWAWAMSDILLVSAFDDYPELMATGSAVSLIATAGGRAFGPALAGWLFSISTQFPTGSLGRQTSWIYLTLATMPAVSLARFLPLDSAAAGGQGGGAGGRPSKSEYEQVPLVESGFGLGVDVDGLEYGRGRHSFEGRSPIEGADEADGPEGAVRTTGVNLHYEENDEVDRLRGKA